MITNFKPDKQKTEIYGIKEKKGQESNTSLPIK